LGHLSVINEISQYTQKELIIGIWTPNNKFLNDKNPFTFTERKEMISWNLSKKISIVWIPDFNDNNIWRQYIEENIKPDKIITGNDLVKSIFSDKLLEITTRYNNISSTMIRKKILNYDNIKNFVSDFTLQYLFKNNLILRLQKIKSGLKIKNPEYEKWKLQKK